MTPEQVRADALFRLGVRFKSGDTPGRRIDDLEKIDKLGIETVDLLEAVERIEFTRQTATYPPLAEILAQCRDAKATRVSHSDVPPPGQTYDRPMNGSELAHCRDIVALYRAKQVWCPVCQIYKPNCAVHANRPWTVSPTASQTSSALSALPPVVSSATKLPRSSKIAARRIPTPPTAEVAAGIEYVVEQRRLRDGKRCADRAPAVTDPVTPGLSSLKEEMGGMF